MTVDSSPRDLEVCHRVGRESLKVEARTVRVCSSYKVKSRLSLWTSVLTREGPSKSKDY